MSFFSLRATSLTLYSYIFFKEKDALSDIIEAATWCQTQSFHDRVSLPAVIGMDREGQKTALAGLKSNYSRDEEETLLCMEPFLFRFNSQRDYEHFCKELIDRRKLIVSASFEECE